MRGSYHRLSPAAYEATIYKYCEMKERRQSFRRPQAFSCSSHVRCRAGSGHSATARSTAAAVLRLLEAFARNCLYHVPRICFNISMPNYVWSWIMRIVCWQWYNPPQFNGFLPVQGSCLSRYFIFRLVNVVSCFRPCPERWEGGSQLARSGVQILLVAFNTERERCSGGPREPIVTERPSKLTYTSVMLSHRRDIGLHGKAEQGLVVGRMVQR